MSKTRLALLRITEPVYVVIETTQENDDTLAYAIDEGNCPSDVLRYVTGVITDDGNHDPHGVIELVEAVDMPADWPFVGTVTIDRYRQLFPALRVTRG